MPVSASFQYFRWFINKRRFANGQRTNDAVDSVQAADFRLTFTGSHVPWSGSATASNPGGTFQSGPTYFEMPNQLLDNSGSTKWVDTSQIASLGSAVSSTIIINNYAPLTFDGYQIRTANDAEGRDPTGWTLEGSLDGTTWTLLDTRADETASVPITANKLTHIYTLNNYVGSGSVIYSFSPTSGPTGSVVTISGSNLHNTTFVKLGNSIQLLTNVNSESIVLNINPTASSGYFVVTTTDGFASASSIFTVTSLPLPTITSFSPTGSTTGSTVTISGSNLNGVTSVKLGNSIQLLNNVVSGSIVLTIQPTASTDYFVVTTPVGSVSASTIFTVLTGSVNSTNAKAPIITSFTPIAGATGSLVTISGSNLNGTTTVTLGNVSQVLNNVTSGSIVFTLQSGSSTNYFVVTTPIGSVSASTLYSVVYPVVNSVKVNGVAVTSYTVDSPTQITAVLAANTTTGKVTVQTTGGSATSSIDYTSVYPYTQFQYVSGTYTNVPPVNVVITPAIQVEAWNSGSLARDVYYTGSITLGVSVPIPNGYSIVSGTVTRTAISGAASFNDIVYTSGSIQISSQSAYRRGSLFGSLFN